MSKGKKYNTPKRFWKNMKKKTRRPEYGYMSWRYKRPHVMGRNHKKFKWFFRKKSWFTDNFLQKMSMRMPMSHEIWGWD